MKCNCCGHELTKDFLGTCCLNETCESIDGTTVINQFGKYWYKNGKHHRDDGPAIEMACGIKYWYKNGKHHREDGPAVEFLDDTVS